MRFLHVLMWCLLSLAACRSTESTDLPRRATWTKKEATEAQRHLELARRYLKVGSIERAKTECRRALDVIPGHLEATTLLEGIKKALRNRLGWDYWNGIPLTAGALRSGSEDWVKRVKFSRGGYCGNYVASRTGLWFVGDLAEWCWIIKTDRPAPTKWLELLSSSPIVRKLTSNRSKNDREPIVDFEFRGDRKCWVTVEAKLGIDHRGRLAYVSLRRKSSTRWPDPFVVIPKSD